MRFTLPDLLRICPFSSSFSPHFESVAPESKAWIDGFEILLGRQRRYFSTSAFELLAAHTYPYADREGYRTSCDFLNVTFILDDYSDDEGKRGARVMADSFMSALRDPTWDDGTAFAKLARELAHLTPLPLLPATNDTIIRFRRRLDTASATARQRFIDTFDHYLDATVSEAENREHGTILGLEDFTELRRGNSGVEVGFALIECILSIDLQPEVFDDPTLARLRRLIGDMVFTANVSTLVS